MKRFLPGVAFGVGIAGLFCGSIVPSCILIALVTPALCCQIYELTPFYKRKQKCQDEDFTRWMNYVRKLKAVKDNPTLESLRELHYNGFASNIAYILEHYPIIYEQNVINDISELIVEAKNSPKWKILDVLERIEEHGNGKQV